MNKLNLHLDWVTGAIVNRYRKRKNVRYKELPMLQQNPRNEGIVMHWDNSDCTYHGLLWKQGDYLEEKRTHRIPDEVIEANPVIFVFKQLTA